jgi:single-strand DNA-binding protein
VAEVVLFVNRKVFSVAKLNKYICIGKLTRDPEFKSFQTGTRMVQIGIAVPEGKKNQQTGQWEETPVFIDGVMFNGSGTWKPVDNFEKLGLQKGAEVCIVGKLQLDTWDDKTTGQKRSKHKIMIETIEPTAPRAARSDIGAPQQSPAPSRPQQQPQQHQQQAFNSGYDDFGGSADVPF